MPPGPKQECLTEEQKYLNLRTNCYNTCLELAPKLRELNATCIKLAKEEDLFSTSQQRRSEAEAQTQASASASANLSHLRSNVQQATNTIRVIRAEHKYERAHKHKTRQSYSTKIPIFDICDKTKPRETHRRANIVQAVEYLNWALPELISTTAKEKRKLTKIQIHLFNTTAKEERKLMKIQIFLLQNQRLVQRSRHAINRLVEMDEKCKQLKLDSIFLDKPDLKAAIDSFQQVANNL